MKEFPLPRPLFLLAALILPLLLVLAACNGDDDEEIPDNGTPPPDTNGDQIDISNVPELQDGVLTVGSDIAYAPMEFFQPGTETPDGFSVDLANALADILGVRAEFINSDFDGLILSLTTREFDVIISSMTITPEREAQIAFVPYLDVGTGILVEAGNPEGIQDMDGLCGLTVAVQVGTIQVDLLNDQNDECDDPIDIVTFDTHPLAVLDLRTGGAQAVLGDFPVVLLDAEESDGVLELVDFQVDPEPYGIGVHTDSTELRSALEQAMDELRASNRYMEILQNWDLESAALD